MDSLIELRATADRTELALLAREMWDWRIENQPRSPDDMMRVTRPPGWRPDWAPERVEQRRHDAARFRRDLERTGADATSTHVALLKSLLGRVEWELDALAAWRTDPGFYVDETLGHLFDYLLRPAPFGSERIEALTSQLAAIPATLAAASLNLDHVDQALARVALGKTADLAARLERVLVELRTATDDPLTRWPTLLQDATEAFTGFRSLVAEKASDGVARPIGAPAYESFLREVALLPYHGSDLQRLARAELERTALLEEAETRRPSSSTRATPDPLRLLAQQAIDEAEVRNFLADHDLLRLPAALPRYRLRWLPGYLEPLADLGVADDLCGPARLEDEATSYVARSGDTRGFFAEALRADSRLGVVHEGIHFYQLSMAWRNDDWLRRAFYDSTPHEGIAFYTEELVLRVGLFDDLPDSRLRLIRFMRLRACRVLVDIHLATGEMAVPEAASWLAETVPMDLPTAYQEAAFFRASPGQAIAYLAGKAQIQALLERARRRVSTGFDLAAFHAWLWSNGNVPIALLERELDAMAPFERG